MTMFGIYHVNNWLNVYFKNLIWQITRIVLNRPTFLPALPRLLAMSSRVFNRAIGWINKFSLSIQTEIYAWQMIWTFTNFTVFQGRRHIWWEYLVDFYNRRKPEWTRRSRTNLTAVILVEYEADALPAVSQSRRIFCIGRGWKGRRIRACTSYLQLANPVRNDEGN